MDEDTDMLPPWEEAVDTYDHGGEDGFLTAAETYEEKAPSSLKSSITLSDQQGKAVKSFREWFKSPAIPKWDRDGNAEYFLFNGYAGCGKAVPNGTKISCPTGWRNIEDLKIGDEVMSPTTGTPIKVIGVYPQGKQKTYKVGFRDGTFARCNGEHLWAVKTPKDLQTGKDWRVMTLNAIRDMGVKMPCGLARYRIPLTVPVEFPARDYFINPYLLGLLIGDGCMTQEGKIELTIGNLDKDIIDILDIEDGYHICTRHKSGCTGVGIRLNESPASSGDYWQEISRLRLDVYSYGKFIPQEYKFGSAAQRLDLLRGLMDSDGSVRQNRTEFSTSSMTLAYDVVELVQSLGGTAIISSCDRGNKGVDWHVNVKMLADNPFKCLRKAAKWSPSWKNPPSRYIWSIDEDGEDEHICIKVDHEDGLFMVNDYIVTHNTTVLPFFIDESGLDFSQVLFVAPTGKASKVMAKKLFNHGVRSTCSTIHKAIYRPQAMKAFQIERDLESVQTALGIARNEGDGDMIKELSRREKQLRKDLDRAYDEAAPKFQLNVEAKIAEEYSLIVVDECSMVGESMAEDLRSFGVPILAIGDPFQLQPVGDDPGFCNRDADAALTEVHRQAADNPIIWASMRVRAGKPLQLGSHGEGQLRVLTRKQDDVTFDIDRDVQILVGTHQKRWQITREIRKLSGLHLEGPAAGEIMICNKNSLKYPNLVNGTMLMVEDDVGQMQSGDVTFDMRVRDEDGNVYDCSCIQSVIEEHYLGKGNSTAPKPVVFKAKQQRGNDQIDFGYAITVHKSQGSQWDEVVLHDEGNMFREQSDNWRYTGITRAAEKLTVIVP